VALVLLDIGSPESEADAGAFLQRVYSDPHVMQFPLSGAFLDLLALGFSLMRRGSLRAMLRAVGGKAPERAELERLATVLALGLSARLKTRVQPFVAYRHANPGITEIFQQARGAGCRRVVGVFARTFASSAGSESMRAELSLSANEFPDLDTSMVDGFEAPAAIRKAFAVEAKNALDSIPQDERSAAHLMFLIQGQPIRGKVDPVLMRAKVFAEVVREAMGVSNPCSVAYQNGVDPHAAMLPDASEEIEQLAAAKTRALVLIPAAHACEGLFTRWELDTVLVEQARKAGIAHVRRSRAPAEGADFRAALEELVAKHLDEMEKLQAIE